MRRRSLQRHILAAGAAGAALAVTAAVLPTLPAGATIADPTRADAKDNSATYDVRRSASVKPTQAQLDAVAKVLSAASSGARATWDDRFGTPRSIYGGTGYLTGAHTGSAEDVARSWVSDNRDAFGMSAADVSAMKVQRDHKLPGTGTHVVTFAQVFDGIAAVRGGRLNIAVTDDGRVLSYAGNPTRGDEVVGSYALSPAEALGAVAKNLAGQDVTPQTSGERAGFTEFAKGPFAG